MAKAMKGRGQVKIITNTPDKFKEREQEGGANKFMHKATEKLRQARRCEQITTRLKHMGNVGADQKEKYLRYNQACISKFLKHLNDKESDEHELKKKIKGKEEGAGGDVMMLPT